MGPTGGRARHARVGRWPIPGMPTRQGFCGSRRRGAGGAGRLRQPARPVLLPSRLGPWSVTGAAPCQGRRRRREEQGPWGRGPAGTNEVSRNALHASGGGGGASTRGGAAGQGGVRGAVRAVGWPWCAAGQRRITAAVPLQADEPRRACAPPGQSPCVPPVCHVSHRRGVSAGKLPAWWGRGGVGGSPSRRVGILPGRGPHGSRSRSGGLVQARGQTRATPRAWAVPTPPLPRRRCAGAGQEGRQTGGHPEGVGACPYGP